MKKKTYTPKFNTIEPELEKVLLGGGYVQYVWAGIPIITFDKKVIWLNTENNKRKGIKFALNQLAKKFKLKFKLFQKDFIWYITYNDKTQKFVDGMRLVR